MKETIVKINKTKSWFFDKIKKIDKPLARLIKKKREKNQINRIRNEKGEVTQTMQKYKDYKRLFSSVREGDGTPLQYSCLENPMDRGAW